MQGLPETGWRPGDFERRRPDGFAMGEEAEETALALLALLFARIGTGGEWEGLSFGGFHVCWLLAERNGCRDTLRAVRKALYGRGEQDLAGSEVKLLSAWGLLFWNRRDRVGGGCDLGRELGDEGGTVASRRQTGRRDKVSRALGFFFLWTGGERGLDAGSLAAHGARSGCYFRRGD